MNNSFSEQYEAYMQSRSDEIHAGYDPNSPDEIAKNKAAQAAQERRTKNDAAREQKQKNADTKDERHQKSAQELIEADPYFSLKKSHGATIGVGDFLPADHEVRSKIFSHWTIEPSLTQLDDMESADLNYLIKTFFQNQIPTPDYEFSDEVVDLTNIDSFEDHLMRAKHMNDLFNAFPSEIRERFRNDPLRLARWLQDPANQDEAVRLGLVKRPTPTAAPEAEKPSAPPANAAAPTTTT